MNVAVIGPVAPYRGGIAHYTAQLARHVSQRHPTRVYSFRQQYPAWLFPGRSQFDPGASTFAATEARLWLLPWWPPSWRRVEQDWRAWRPDLVVMQWWVPFMAPMTAWLIGGARRMHARVVVICHNVLPHDRSLLDAPLARLALRQADRLVVHSLPDQAQAQSLLPGHPVARVSFPGDLTFSSIAWTREDARAKLGVEGRVLLFFGFVRPYKGLLDLLNALPAVLAETEATLMVVGEIWGESSRYFDRVRELGLEAAVRFIDRYVSNEEAAMYFAAADLVILPYRSATGSAVLKLAFSLGVPVVATCTGDMAEAVQHGVTGLLVPPADVPGLSQAITRFFREDLSSEFRLAIRRSASRFTWDDLVEAMLQPGQR